jgi:hypothetical protein
MHQTVVKGAKNMWKKRKKVQNVNAMRKYIEIKIRSALLL